MATTYINFHAPVDIQTVQNLMAAISQKLAYPRRAVFPAVYFHTRRQAFRPKGYW
jgi:hypothetical protein